MKTVSCRKIVSIAIAIFCTWSLSAFAGPITIGSDPVKPIGSSSNFPSGNVTLPTPRISLVNQGGNNGIHGIPAEVLINRPFNISVSITNKGIVRSPIGAVYIGAYKKFRRNGRVATAPVGEERYMAPISRNETKRVRLRNPVEFSRVDDQVKVCVQIRKATTTDFTKNPRLICSEWFRVTEPTPPPCSGKMFFKGSITSRNGCHTELFVDVNVGADTDVDNHRVYSGEVLLQPLRSEPHCIGGRGDVRGSSRGTRLEFGGNVRLDQIGHQRVNFVGRVNFPSCSEASGTFDVPALNDRGDFRIDFDH